MGRYGLIDEHSNQNMRGQKKSQRRGSQPVGRRPFDTGLGYFVISLSVFGFALLLLSRATVDFLVFLWSQKGFKISLIVLFVALFAWGLSSNAAADERKKALTVGLGYGYAATKDLISQRIGYLHDDRWFVRYERLGGPGLDHDDFNSIALGRRVMWREDKRIEPFLEFGAAYFDEPPTRSGKPVVSERLTYSMSIGARFFDVIEFVFADHNSTAGRSERNKGIDRVALTFILKF